MKKVIIILLFIFSIIIPFRTDFFAVKIYASENENIDYSFKNVASPDLTGREYLGNGIYRLYNDGVTFDFNVYSGVFTLNGTVTSLTQIIRILLDYNYRYTVSYIYENGSISGHLTLGFYQGSSGGYGGTLINKYYYTSNDNAVSEIGADNFRIYAYAGVIYDNLQFKLQIEKGTEATPYTAPLESYLWHEKRLSFEEGYYSGYDGYNDGWSAGYYGGYDDGYDDGYNDGQSDGTVVGTYKVDAWYNNSGSISTMLRFYDVEPSIDGNLSLSLLENKNTLVDNKDLYFNFDYGEFYVTPYINENDYINSGYQYAPFQSLGFGNMLRVQNESMELINKGELVNSYTLSQLKSLYIGFNNLYIIQLVDTNDYYAIFNNGYDAGFDDGQDVGYDAGFDDGQDVGYDAGLGDGYDDGYNDGIGDGYYLGYDLGYDDGYGDGDGFGYYRGYQEAINDGSTEFGLTTLLSSLFVGLGSLLSIQLLPNISIGMIIAVPIVFGIIAFILGKRGGGD